MIFILNSYIYIFKREHRVASAKKNDIFDLPTPIRVDNNQTL